MRAAPTKVSDPRPLSAGPTLRLARATAFAVVSSGLGAVAHLFGGGVVSGRAMMYGLALGFLTALPVAGRERGFGVILPLLTGTQAVLHLIFANVSAVSAVPVCGLGGHTHGGLAPGVGMLVAHGWAVTLTALWLARGEAALWSVLRRLAVRLRLALVTGDDAVTLKVGRGVAAPTTTSLRSVLLRHAVSGRAPPATIGTG
ncbi:MFS transporter [Microtetraspora malaysiensis]|uniref:MFS transporter n=1 Tax=Microtetraspora malaysiensis TaxID=161358 RepID=UPI003D8B98AC